MISDSVELCETAVCFLHIQLIGTNVWLPKMHNVPPESGFWIFKISRKVRVLKQSPICIVWQYLPTWQHCLYSHVWWMYEINLFRRLSQALVHFVIFRANLFTDHRISGLPISAKYKHFRTIWEHTCDNSPTDFISSSLRWVVIDAWSRYFVELLRLLFGQLTISFHTLLCMTSHVCKTHEEIRRFWGNGNFSAPSAENSRFKHGSVIVHSIFAYFALSLSAAQVYMIKESCWFAQINFFVECVPHRIKILFSFQPILCHPHTRIRIILFSTMYKEDIPQFRIFSQPCFNRIFSNWPFP